MAISSELAERLALVGISAEGRALLEKFQPTLLRELPAIIAKFYTFIGSTPELARMFDGASSMNRASKAQITHWARLFSGKFDDEYVASVKQVGFVHSRIGLDPRWYIGGYSFVLKQLYELIGTLHASRFGGGAEKTAKLIAALNQAALLDMELAISCYLDQNKLNFDKRLVELSGQFETKVGTLVDQLATASEELEATARSMTDTTDKANQRAMTVAAAAEQASAGTQTVASAAEQLSASIDLIAQQVNQSSSKTAQAVQSAAQTDQVVRALSEGADHVGMVINMIGQIANKTNMLALNASIEAARAGESGRAFEIVATEVKNLATQTSRATIEVEAQIIKIQHATREAVGAIAGIAGVIEEIAAIGTTISGALHEQNAATNEISRNVQQTAQAAQEVAMNIVTVSQASEMTGAAASQIYASAGGISQQASLLSAEVESFIDNVKAAA